MEGFSGGAAFQHFMAPESVMFFEKILVANGKFSKKIDTVAENFKKRLDREPAIPKKDQCRC